MVTAINFIEWRAHANFIYGKGNIFLSKEVFIFQIWTFIFVHFEILDLLFEIFISIN
jgi:hypothetical protein